MKREVKGSVLPIVNATINDFRVIILSFRERHRMDTEANIANPPTPTSLNTLHTSPDVIRSSLFK